jgi:hypothetical protein
LPEVILGHRRGSWCVLQQKKLALDAQQLGNAPAGFIALGSRERFVERLEPLSNLPGATKPRCQLAKEPSEAGLGSLLKSNAQKL